MSSGVGDRPDSLHSRTYSNGKPKPSLSKLRQPSQTKLQVPSVSTKSKTGSAKSQLKAPTLQNVANDLSASPSPRPLRRSSGLKAPASVKSSNKTVSTKAASTKAVSTKGLSCKPTSETKSPTPKPPRRSAPLTETRAKPKRTGSKSQTNSPGQSDAGPVAPPRSGAGIKRSVTARQSTSKSLAAAPAPSKTKVCKHPSLEMERSISSESNISSESINSRNSNRTPTGRTVKMRQPTKVPDRSSSQSKRTLKRPSNRARPSELELSKRSRPSELREPVSKENHAVKYSETKTAKSQDSLESKSQESLESKSHESLESKSHESLESKSHESLESKKVEQSGASKTKRSSMPSVIISPSELLLNQSLHDKLAQNQSNRHGFVLTDTDASVLSCGSSEFLSADERSDHEIVLTSADLMLNRSDVDRSDVDRCRTLSSSELVSTDTDYDEVADCARQDLTPVRPDFSAVLRRDIASQISSSSTLNDLSDPNRSPSLNITLDEYGYSDDLTTPVQNTPSLHSMIPIPAQQPISDQDWNNKEANGKLYNSPDDNFQEPKKSDKELYYDSSDLNLDGSSSEEVDKELSSGLIDKELNSQLIVDKELNSQLIVDKELNSEQTVDKELNSERIDKELNRAQESSSPNEKIKNNTVEQNMYTSFLDKAVSTEEKDVEIKLSDNCETSSSTDEQKPAPSFRLGLELPIDTRAEDVLSPLISETADPLSILSFSHYNVRDTDDYCPEPPFDINTSPSSVILPKKFPDDPIYFTRNQRSIRPSKRKSLLIRSTSLDKKYMSQKSSELQCGSAESFDSDDLYIVQTLTPCSPISISDRDFLNPRTPEILITEDNILDCLDQRQGLWNTPKRRFVLRSKQRSDVTRRFSETQVFKHHKEKYMKRREMEEKYSSCPVPTTPELKLDSPKYIRTLVKRVSSMLTPTSKPRVLMKKGIRDSFGSTSSVYINFDGSAAEARSLQDDSTDNHSSDRLHRSNSLESADDHVSSIRRTHSEKEKHETESSEYPSLTSKAKSISEQLERVKYNLRTDGIPTLEFKSWTELLPESAVQALGKKELEQQHHIWELVTTEHNYITILSTIINSLLGCLRELHTEHFLTKINDHDVFLNVEKIREVHLTFWNECIVPLIQTAKDTGDPLNPEILTAASTLFEEELNPLFEYCIKYIESRSYIKSQQHKNNDFKEYINWCSNQIRVQHNKLGIDDMLIKPIQRIQKYPILIKDILRKTVDEDTRTVLSSFLEKVRVFVELLNRRKEEKEEQQKIDGIKERIESYCVLPSTGSQTNEQINQILSKYNKFDLADKVPLLGTQRKFLHENACKMSATSDSKAQDVLLYLFSDHILVTRPTKNPKKKNKIIKQPMTLDRVVIEELKDVSHTNLIVYLNEYGSLVDMFLLLSNNQESHTTLFNAVIQAKDNYVREKNKLYTELDASKSASTCSVNSAGNHLASPCISRHPLSCTITRSSSEHYPPTRRVQVDPASSVARAQSMPASNEKRHLLPPTMSSGSSSASSSSSSVSEHSAASSDSSKPATLSDIKETDKSPDSAEDPTVVSQPDNIKTFDDVYISDNLSTEFKGKLDMNKNICDSVNLTAQADKMLFSKSDAIFIDHHNHQSES